MELATENYHSVVLYLQNLNENIVKLFTAYKPQPAIAIPPPPIVQQSNPLPIRALVTVLIVAGCGVALINYKKKIQKASCCVWSYCVDVLTCKDIRDNIKRLEGEVNALKLSVAEMKKLKE
jgi:hypothetical protein